MARRMPGSRAGPRTAQHRPVGGATHGPREYRLKRSKDQLLAVAALIALMPLLMMIAALVHFGDRGPIFFSQWRLGHQGRYFRCLKFRTMLVDADAALVRHLDADPDAAAEWAAARKLKVDPRITPVGDLLRRTSLDELPQLINIARGEMSIVGPRPIVREEAEYYGDALGEYLAVRPGLTGLWQISGRNDVGYDERVELDRHYVSTMTLGGDLLIILRTVHAVLGRRGSY
jgi:exopolysaccharide production protein ExoY